MKKNLHKMVAMPTSALLPPRGGARGITRFFSVMFLCSVCTALPAQKREAVQLSNRYNDVTQIMSGATQYLLPQFTDGTVMFNTGERASAKLNYNILLEQMQFIGDDSSVMAIANLEAVQYVSIGKRFFVKYKSAFIEVLLDGEVQLGVARKLRIVDHRKDGGYGGATSLMKVESVSAMDGAPADHLTGTEELIFEESRIYYLIKNLKPKVANKKTFIKAFPACKEEIAKQKDVDYSKEEQLRALVILCQSVEN
ncbi:MAG: hypothetical protein LBB79_06765 [Prevotellaceae bacterium]|jgi:hypothetical protein|nr:hypothetical protein [Prevotellaceae bacterium]